MEHAKLHCQTIADREVLEERRWQHNEDLRKEISHANGTTL
jgi:hypothetical protein